MAESGLITPQWDHKTCGIEKEGPNPTIDKEWLREKRP